MRKLHKTSTMKKQYTSNCITCLNIEYIVIQDQGFSCTDECLCVRSAGVVDARRERTGTRSVLYPSQRDGRQLPEGLCSSSLLFLNHVNT